MNGRRAFFHPVMVHRRGLMILGWYLAAATISSAALLWPLETLIRNAGLGDGGLIFSRTFRALVVLGSCLFAAVVTAGALAGPVHRIESWLRERAAGGARALRVRGGDPFETLIRLLNEIHVKTAPSRVKRAPRKRATAPRPPKLRAL